RLVYFPERLCGRKASGYWFILHGLSQGRNSALGFRSQRADGLGGLGAHVAVRILKRLDPRTERLPFGNRITRRGAVRPAPMPWSKESCDQQRGDDVLFHGLLR